MRRAKDEDKRILVALDTLNGDVNFRVFMEHIDQRINKYTQQLTTSVASDMYKEIVRTEALRERVRELKEIKSLVENAHRGLEQLSKELESV